MAAPRQLSIRHIFGMKDAHMRSRREGVSYNRCSVPSNAALAAYTVVIVWRTLVQLGRRIITSITDVHHHQDSSDGLPKCRFWGMEYRY